MEDNVQEFLELAQDSDDPSEEAAQALKKAVRSPSRDPFDEEDEEGPKTESVCQYAVHGDGFRFSGSTAKKLPPGVYDVRSAQGVGVYLGIQNIVTDSLIRLSDSKSDEVIAEIERFWLLKDRFKQFGFVHKRGFLLWGPPGSGKTSTVSWIIKTMVSRGGIVIMGDWPEGTTDALGKIRKIEPERPVVVVMEDLDTIIQRHGESETLALLDGEASIDNVVFVATTNYPQNLDGRITNRPSRFDRVVKIGTPNAQARLQYLKSRKLPLSESEYSLWVEKTEGFSIAHLKEVIVGTQCLMESFDKVIARLTSMKKKPRSEDGEALGFSK